MRVLLTGVRAPISLELVRLLSSAGHQVFLADGMRFPVSRLTNRKTAYCHVPGPNREPQSYIESVNRLIQQHRIELLIPICEEIFCLSFYRERINCPVWCSDFEQLVRRHNKWQFSQTATNSFASFPETRLLHSLKDTHEMRSELDRWVFKPVWSRFACQTLIGPKPNQLDRCEMGDEQPWIAQQRIRGREFSSFSLVENGVVRFHVSYQSLYRAGKGAGIYFESIVHPRIRDFVQEEVRRTNFSGQIGFDFMEDGDGKLFAIECNPRGTSGWHFLADEAGVAEALQKLAVSTPSEAGRLVDDDGSIFEIPAGRRKMVGFAMPLWGLSSAIRGNRIHRWPIDLFRANEVVFRWRDPLPALVGAPLAMAELFANSFTHWVSPQQVSTYDFEYNGRKFEP